MTVLNRAVVMAGKMYRYLREFMDPAALKAAEGYSFPAVGVGPLHRLDDIGGVAAGGNGQEDILGPELVFQGFGENAVERQVVTDGGQPGHIVGEADNTQPAAARGHRPLAEIAGHVRSGGGAASIADDVDRSAIAPSRMEYICHASDGRKVDGLKHELQAGKVIPGMLLDSEHRLVIHVDNAGALAFEHKFNMPQLGQGGDEGGSPCRFTIKQEEATATRAQ